MSFTNGKFTCDRCGADCGSGAVPSECSPLIVPAENSEGRQLLHFCPTCTQAILTFATS